MMRDLLQDLEPDQAPAATASGSRQDRSRLHTVGSSLGGEGLNGWHSEQEGDPPGGRIPFNLCRD